MVHLWLVDNPYGLFAHWHPGLTGSDEYVSPIKAGTGQPAVVPGLTGN